MFSVVTIKQKISIDRNTTSFSQYMIIISMSKYLQVCFAGALVVSIIARDKHMKSGPLLVIVVCMYVCMFVAVLSPRTSRKET